MSQVYDQLTDALIAFIEGQRIYFVATAPLAAEGSVNLSPKGYDETFRIIDRRTVAYLDIGGSGIETHAHVRENGRLTLMFCAFDGSANILRLYGRGEAVAIGEPGFEAARALFPDYPGRARGVITLHIERVADSCGWGVPFFEFKGDREQLRRWADNKPEAEWLERRYESNARSIDGLPGLVRPDHAPT